MKPLIFCLYFLFSNSAFSWGPDNTLGTVDVPLHIVKENIPQLFTLTFKNSEFFETPELLPQTIDIQENRSLLADSLFFYLIELSIEDPQERRNLILNKPDRYKFEAQILDQGEKFKMECLLFVSLSEQTLETHKMYFQLGTKDDSTCSLTNTKNSIKEPLFWEKTDSFPQYFFNL